MNQRGLPPGVAQQLQQVQQMRGAGPIIGQQPQQPPRKMSFREANPLPHGLKGMQTLRATVDCGIVKEAEAFKNVIPKLQYLNADIEDLLELYGQGVATIVGADHYCNHHTQTRTAVTFSEDPTLNQLHNNLQETIKELQGLMQKMGELRQKAQTLNEQRWEQAIKIMGLNPDERFYRIDEEKGIIEQVDLKCHECKGAVRSRKLRQELTEKLMRLEYVKEEEPKNDGERTGDNEPGASEGNAADRGEVCSTEQKVSGVADQPDASGCDGGNGAGEAD